MKHILYLVHYLISYTATSYFSKLSTNKDSSSQRSIFSNNVSSNSCCSSYNFWTFSKSLPCSLISFLSLSRSEERRVGKECSFQLSRGCYTEKKNGLHSKSVIMVVK